MFNKFVNCVKMNLNQLHRFFGCGITYDPVRNSIIMLALFFGTVFTLEPIGEMISTWLQKPKSPSLSTRSSNQAVEEIICNLKDVNKKRIKDRDELEEAKREIENLKEELEELRREVRAGKKNDKDASHSAKSTHKHGKENQNARSRSREAEGIDERETAIRKGSKLRRWNEKIKRRLNREAKHDPMWDELREELLRDWQKLSRSQVISENEIKDILQDVEEMFINSELEVEKEEIEGGSQEETEETPEWEPDDVLENAEIIEEIREILEEEKAERRSKRRWEKNAWKSVIREHKERKAKERADKKLIKQQLLSRKREEKERRKAQMEVEKWWISALKRNITKQLEERKQKRRDDRLRKLKDLIEFVKLERKIMKYKRRADQEWLEREVRSLAHDRQVRMEERKREKEARRAYKQELKERNAKLKAEEDRLKREMRAKLEEEHKKAKTKAKLEKQRLKSALKDLKRRKRDLGRKRKPKRSEVELQMHDYIWFFLKNPAMISLYLRNGPLKRRKKRKRATKATDSQKEIWVWKKNSRGKFEFIEKKRIDRTASNK